MRGKGGRRGGDVDSVDRIFVGPTPAARSERWPVYVTINVVVLALTRTEGASCSHSCPSSPRPLLAAAACAIIWLPRTNAQRLAGWRAESQVAWRVAVGATLGGERM